MTDERNDSHENEQGHSRSCGGGRRHGHHHSPRSEGHGRRHRRKERVLHTRISEQLSDDIRRLADDLRVPVSNVVRNVLEEVFTVVDNVSGDVGDFFEEVLDEAESVRERIRNRQEGRPGAGGRRRRHRRRGADLRDVEEELERDEASEAQAEATPEAEEERPSLAFPEVLGWQPIVLNRALDCAGCAAPLDAGDRAFVGIGAPDSTQVILCSGCVESL